MADTFVADSKVADIAAAYSLDAVDLAENNFGIKLDWTDTSIQRVEVILGRLHEDIATSKPPEEKVWTFAKAFGSYVGEVLIKQHGGEWGTVTLDGESFPGIQTGEQLCWPWGRAHKRIVNGPEENVWHYHQTLFQSADDPANLDNHQSSKKPWWRFW